MNTDIWYSFSMSTSLTIYRIRRTNCYPNSGPNDVYPTGNSLGSTVYYVVVVVCRIVNRLMKIQIEP